MSNAETRINECRTTNIPNAVSLTQAPQRKGRGAVLRTKHAVRTKTTCPVANTHLQDRKGLLVVSDANLALVERGSSSPFPLDRPEDGLTGQSEIVSRYVHDGTRHSMHKSSRYG